MSDPVCYLLFVVCVLDDNTVCVGACVLSLGAASASAVLCTVMLASGCMLWRKEAIRLMLLQFIRDPLQHTV